MQEMRRKNYTCCSPAVSLPDCSSDYIRLAGPLSNDSELSENELYFIELYRRASDDDRDVIKHILKKYEDPTRNERASAG